MKKILGILLFTSLALTAQAQLLWKVSGNGLTKPSYIIGTHHLAPFSILDSIKGWRPAFASTEQVYGELVMKETQSSAAMQTLQQKMMTGSDTTFQSLFSPQEYAMIHSTTQENLKFDLTMMPKLRPSFLLNHLIIALYMKQVGGFNPQEQLDTYFQTVAAAENKKVGGLETLDFQFNLLFNGTSLKRQAQLLLCQLNNLDKVIDQLKELTSAYMKQDLDALFQLSEKREGNQCDPLPGEMEATLDNRNKAWAEKLPAIMKEAPTFVVVGALHLPGENGLLKLLKKQGYTVESVR